MTSWRQFTGALPEPEHKRLVIALGAGLMSARQASEIATGDGDVDEARRHVAAAVAQLSDALVLLRPPAVT